MSRGGEGGRRPNMTGGRRREEGITLNCTRLVHFCFVFFEARLSKIPHSAWQKQKVLSVSCSPETADWFQPSNPNIRELIQRCRGPGGAPGQNLHRDWRKNSRNSRATCKTMCGEWIQVTDRAGGVFLAWGEGFATVCQVYLEVCSLLTQAIAKATVSNTQCCAHDTDHGCRTRARRSKLNLWKVKVSPIRPRPLTGTATGSGLNPRVFVPSERPAGRGFTGAEPTRWDHWKRTYEQRRQRENAMASPSCRAAEITRDRLRAHTSGTTSRWVACDSTPLCDRKSCQIILKHNPRLFVLPQEPFKVVLLRPAGKASTRSTYKKLPLKGSLSVSSPCGYGNGPEEVENVPTAWNTRKDLQEKLQENAYRFWVRPVYLRPMTACSNHVKTKISGKAVLGLSTCSDLK